MFCRNCGKEIKEQEKFCPYCGSKVEEGVNAEKQSEIPKNNEKNKSVGIKAVVGIVVLVVVVAGAFCGYHFLKKNNVQQSKLKKEQLEKNVKKQVNQLTDVENFINKSADELEKEGFISKGSDTYENDNGSIQIKVSNQSVSSITMNENCTNPFHGIYIGDKYDDIKDKLEEKYKMLGTTESGDVFGIIEEKILVTVKTANGNVRGITIDAGYDMSEYEQEAMFTDFPGVGGTYYDSETGERLVIASTDSTWAFTYYDADGSVIYSAAECEGNYDDDDNLSSIWNGDMTGYIIQGNGDGTFEISSGMGQPWGYFRKISGTDTVTAKIEGTYKNGDDTIVISNQLEDIDNDNIPWGVTMADAVITFNNGSVINGTLYLQGNGTLAVIDNISKEVKGIFTFEKDKIVVTGSMFDGDFTK